ncbi:MAG TPA: hypothetical protein PK286_08960 [Devosia sp.]|nr:hypothetical protein [Devosia sp.]
MDEAIRNRGTPSLKHETPALALQNQIGDLHREVAGQRFGFLGGIWENPAASSARSARAPWPGAAFMDTPGSSISPAASRSSR